MTTLSLPLGSSIQDDLNASLFTPPRSSVKKERLTPHIPTLADLPIQVLEEIGRKLGRDDRNSLALTARAFSTPMRNIVSRIVVESAPLSAALLVYPQATTIYGFDLRPIHLPSASGTMLQWQKIQRMTLTQCLQLSTLPAFDYMVSLQTLVISNCKYLRHLSAPLPPNLLHLRILYCPRLGGVDLHHINHLEYLEVRSCATLSSIGQYLPSSLKMIILQELYWLSRLPSLEHCQSLHTLHITKAFSLTSLGQRFPSSLRHLRLQHLTRMTTIPSLDDLVFLECIQIIQCLHLRHQA